MEFLWPNMLWLLLLVPLLLAVYVWTQRRRQRYALRYASLSLVREALGKGPGIRRHIPPALFLIALAVMIVGLARPQGVVILPKQEGTVVLVIDVSGSMRYGSGPLDKYEYGCTIAASLAYLLLQQQDAVGCLAFDQAIRAKVPQRTRRSHLNSLIGMSLFLINPKTSV